MAGLSTIYKKLIISFVFILFLLGAVIVYFTLNKVEITIFPKLVNKQAQFYVDVYEEMPENPGGENLTVTGQIEELDVEISGTYNATGEKEISADGDYPIVGKVTLFNDQSEEQSLIRKTRLLSPDDKLFRLSEKVSIPAEGSLEVDVYYDPEETEFEKVGPAKFTIPGLGNSLQELVYAESSEPFIKPGNKVKFVQRSDIENAVEELSAKKLEEVVDSLKSKHGGTSPVALAYKGEVVGEETDAIAGEIADQVTVTVKLKVIAVILDREAIYAAIDEQLNKDLGDGYELVNLVFNNLKYFIDKYDLVANTAQIEVLAEGNLRLTVENENLDKSNFIGLTKEQLVQYFQTMEDVKETEISFYPSWLSKVPSMLDHIHIDIQ